MIVGNSGGFMPFKLAPLSATLFATVSGDDTTFITLPANLQDGDIGILFDTCTSTITIGGATPSNWTSLSNTEIGDGSRFYRCCISYRQLSNSLSGTTVTGGISSFAGSVVKTLFVFRPDNTVSNVTLTGLNQQIDSTANINQQTIIHTIAGLNLHFAVHRTQDISTASISNTVFTPTKTGQVAVSGNREVIDYLIGATANSTCDNGTTSGTYYVLSSMQIKLS